MFAAWDKYAVFEGRATRSEFWLFMLFSFLVGLAAGILDEIVGYLFFVPICIAVLFIPQLAVCVRRLHDLNQSGWWVLVSFLPFLSLFFLICMCLPSRRD